MLRNFLILMSFIISANLVDLSGNKFDLISANSQLPLESELLTNDFLRILCDFKSSVIYFYFELDTTEEFATKLLKGLNYCDTAMIILKNKRRQPQIKIVNDDGILLYMVLVIADAEHTINLRNVKKKSADKYRSFFLVIVESSVDVTNSWLENAFKKFWDLWILNVAIIFWRDGFKIYTYTPFRNNQLIELPSTELHKTDIFSKKIINMHKFPLRIAMYPEEIRAGLNKKGTKFTRGSDAKMAALVTEHLNATKIVMIPADRYAGEIHANGSSDGVIGQIIKNEADVGFNIRFLVPHLYSKKLENSYPSTRDDLCVMVPRAGFASILLNIFRPFQPYVWIMVIATLLGVYILLKIIAPEERVIFIRLYAWSLNIPSTILPKRHIVRFFVSFWLAYSLLIAGSYKGNLTSYLVFPIPLPQIDTLMQLYDTSYKVLIWNKYENHVTRYMNASIPCHKNFLDRLTPVSGDEFKTRLINNDINFAYMDKKHLMWYRIINRRHARRNRPIFHPMSECPVPFHAVYLVSYGSPYLGSINKILRRSKEHGLEDHWQKRLHARIMLTSKRMAINYKDDDPIVLRLNHLRAAFYILVLGEVVAFVIFLTEILITERNEVQNGFEEIKSEVDAKEMDFVQ